MASSMLPMPTLSFSGIGAPTVKEFIAALEGQLSASGAPVLPGQISGRLTGRALLWYTETIRNHHFRLTDDGYRDLRLRLVAEFSLRESNPQRLLRTLTQGCFTVEWYAAEWRALADRLGEDVESYYNRAWWAYGLRAEFQDTAFASICIPSFGELAEEVRRAERTTTARTRRADTDLPQACCFTPAESDWDGDSVWELESNMSTIDMVAEDIQPMKCSAGEAKDAELVKLSGELLRARMLSPS